MVGGQQDPLNAEPGIDRFGLREAAVEDAGDQQDDEGDGHFRRHEPAAEAGASQDRSFAAPGHERIEARKMERRHDAGGQRRGNGGRVAKSAWWHRGSSRSAPGTRW